MARIESVVDELQAYLLRIKQELDPCVEHIARINTNIQTIEHNCGHSLHEPCFRKNPGKRCKFDFNTTLLSAPTPFAQQRAKFIFSNVALALGVKPAVDRNIIAWFLWNTGAKSDCDFAHQWMFCKTRTLCLPRAWNRWVVCYVSALIRGAHCSTFHHKPVL